MGTLSHNWLTEGLIDFEYKKYLLLAYFQQVKEHFKEKKLYPHFADLLFHYQNLIAIKENKKLLQELFPNKLTAADLANLTLAYEQMVKDDEMMTELEDIIQFSIPIFKDHMYEGRDLYDAIENKMQISPIGISPLNPEQGYLFLNPYTTSDTHIYSYRMTIFTQAEERYRGIHLHYMETKPKSISNTYENMKVELVKRHKEMPNPATYLIETKTYAPLEESVLPIAKRVLVKYISVMS